MITKINEQEFETLCLIEQQRIYEQNQHPDWLFWLNNENKLQLGVYMNLLGVDFVRKKTWNEIIKIQLQKDFQQWILQKWQEPCIV